MLARMEPPAAEDVTKPLKGFWLGLQYPVRGLRWVWKRRRSLKRFWLPPVLLAFGCWMGASALVLRHHDDLVTRLWSVPSGEGVSATLLRAIHGVLEVVVALGLLVLVAFTAVVLAQIIAAPFNDALSEHVERLRTGRVPSATGLQGLVGDMLRSVVLEAVKLSVYASVMVPLFLLSWALPGIGTVLYSVVGFGLTLLYLALDSIDWPASRRGLGARARFGWVRAHLGIALGFGLSAWVLLFLPGVNLFLMPAAVCGGTLLYLDVEAAEARHERRSRGL